MTKHILLILSMIIVFSESVQSQLDSLRAELPNAKNDTNHVILLTTIARLSAKSDPSSGLEYAQTALTLSEKISWKKGVAVAKQMLGYNHSIFSGKDSAIYYYSESNKIAEPAGLKSIVGRNSFAIGVAYRNAMEYEKSIEYFDMAISIYEKIGEKRTMASVIDNKAWVLLTLNRHHEALPLYERLEQICEELGSSKGLILAYEGLENTYSDLSNYPKALEYAFKARDHYEAQGDKSGIAFAESGIAGIFQEQNHFEKALEHYQIALKYDTEQEDLNNIGLGLNNIGSVHHSLGDYDQALSYYEKALEQFKLAENPENIALAIYNIGGIHKNDKSFSKALRNYERAFQLFYENRDLVKAAISQGEIGGVYQQIAESEDTQILREFSFNSKKMAFRKALNYTDSAVNQLRIFKDLPNLRYYLNQKSSIEASLGNYQSAFKSFKEYSVLNDSIFNLEKDKKLVQADLKYAFAKREGQLEQKAVADSILNEESKKLKDSEIRVQKAKNKQQEEQKRYLYGGLALALLFGGFIFNRFRVTNKQKGIIEDQKLKVDEAYDELEEKNTEILDSINYAKRIQSAILPPNKLVKQYLENSFILYKPKDIVAGDFYWMEPFAMASGSEGTTEGILFAAADCTGHGVPGAMVSVVCNNGLNRSVREYGLTEPGEILDKTREIVISEFEKSEEDVKDGMDVALCSLQGRTLKYAGAHNPLWIIRKRKTNETPEVISTETTAGSEAEKSLDASKVKRDFSAAVPAGSGEMTSEEQASSDYELIEIKAQFSAETSNNVKVDTMGDYIFIEVKAHKQPIGKYGEPTPYPTHTIELNEGDSFYIFSDGYADQFGGKRGKKFKTANFKKLLLSIQNEPISKQKQLIDAAFEDWKGSGGQAIEQLDDVCVIGVCV